MTEFDANNVTENFDDPGPNIDPMPESIGRYEVREILGRGGFGIVFRAHDRQLDRDVAVKVPRARFSDEQAMESYVVEARIVARLRHPNIVPVYDIGDSDEFPCYIVSQLVSGLSLSDHVKVNQLSYIDATKLIVKVADALHYAHKRGLVHRDVKPGNILVDDEREPHVVDFGLALRDEDVGKANRYAGTPAYMSPEQVRGEGHRVDGRSDIFSLGVVFYELLVGKRPFRGDSKRELFEQVLSLDPRPLRQLNDAIPAELERICLRSLAKRSSERYFTAKDLADDLRGFLESADGQTLVLSTPRALVGGEATPSIVATSSSLSGRAVRIVPKGLRPFDSHDAEFFIQLLPGPRDREGLPDSIRFWKQLIEERDSLRTFSVGMIYGPSGCGKSSLVRAGLLPRLADDIVPIYVEATSDDTEARILHGLRRKCTSLPRDANLIDTMRAIRRDDTQSANQKVLVVIDQFEQWLHVTNDLRSSELVSALRQCDGSRLQCVVMVRDDFWMVASRFMSELEVDLHNGRNMRSADLFDTTHAKRVLLALGRAFGTIPEDSALISSDQKRFIGQSIEDLAEDGRVVPVRLAVFAEMLKGKSWELATLKQVGGTRGIGVKFLEETFNLATSSPIARLHQKGCRAVLASLLPDAGTDIKGEMKSYEELLRIADYTHRADEFRSLIGFLESDVRLVTPTDSTNVAPKAPAESNAGQRYYQLTHDYLVGSLRDWLTQKQAETRKGRAELRLNERASLWAVKPEKRYLPSLIEFLSIQGLTQRENWSEVQQRMMKAAGRVHLARCAIVTLILILGGLSAQLIIGGLQRDHKSQRLKSDIALMRNLRGTAIPLGIRELVDYPEEETVRELQRQFQDSDDVQKLSLACALANFGHVDVPFLVAQIRSVLPREVDNIVNALRKSTDVALQHIHAAADAADSEGDFHLKARLAVIAMHLGDLAIATSMADYGDRGDPIERTIFINEFSAWHGDPSNLVAFAESIDSPSMRSGLSLALGSSQAAEMSSRAKLDWAPTLRSWFRSRPDAGTHSATRWTLMRWQPDVALPKLQRLDVRDDRNWYVNSIGMTMLRIHAGSLFDLQQSEDEESRADVPSFWISDREVSVGSFEAFLNDASYDDSRKPKLNPEIDRIVSPTSDHPVQNVTWFDAVLFCNWLSHCEGLDPAYVRMDNTWIVAAEADGYRLPRESEWEYACRAGTSTRYASGDDPIALPDYARFNDATAQVCGKLLPNAWGLFDMHGNVQEWCDGKNGSLFRGGPFGLNLHFVRSQSSFDFQADSEANNGGFRVVRSN